jgi:splicing factor 3B subunit 3
MKINWRSRVVGLKKMFLYNLTLAPPSAILMAIVGNFSGGKMQEIITASNSHLSLLKADPTAGKVVIITSFNIFGIIRSISPFRLPGSAKDYIVVGSDSGRIAILEYLQDKNTFSVVHMETFGKSGCRRIVPGQYVAVDPKGRAVMIGSMEKSKFVYVLNRDIQSKLTISSPLEAHKSHIITWDIIGVDVGFENPTFACIELDYSEADQDPSGEAFKEAIKVG